MSDNPITGRCYCGAITIAAPNRPQSVTYCHCESCRRSTGAPVTAWAGFAENEVNFTPNNGKAANVSEGVERRFCPDCGTPIMARYDYLPGQLFIPVSVLDQVGALAPTLHAHDGERLPWLDIRDGHERCNASSRSLLNVEK